MPIKRGAGFTAEWLNSVVMMKRITVPTSCLSSALRAAFHARSFGAIRTHIKKFVIPNISLRRKCSRILTSHLVR